MNIIEGSYKTKNGYADGIHGKGFILNALEAALWAFYNDENSYEKGVLLAVNLGDDTDTTAAIYGQLAGAVYGIEEIPQRWRDRLFQINFILTLANGLYLKGKKFNRHKRKSNAIEDIFVRLK
jgi:ADP-ribosyl-[dinitrogen reductase] hydrolase